MIDTNYLQVLKAEDEINHLYMETVNEIDGIVSPLNVLKMQRDQEIELGIFTEAADVSYTESVKDVVTKLGEKIIEIIERIRDFIKSIPDKFKEITWKKSDVDKRMEMVKKKDPKRYETMKVYIEKGMLDFNTFDSMKSFYDSYDDLMKELEKKDVDEKSLRGKLDKLKKKINDNADTIKAVSVAFGIVAAAGTLAMNYKKFKNESDKLAENEASRISDAAYKRSKDAERLSRIIKDHEKYGINGNTKEYILSQALAELEKETKLNVSKLTKFRMFMWKRFDAIAPKSGDSNDSYDKLRSDLLSESSRLSKVAKYNRAIHYTQVKNNPPMK